MRIQLLAAILCLASAASGQANHVLPSLPADPGYPDEKPLVIGGGTISFDFQVDGSVTRQPRPNLTIIHSLRVAAAETIVLDGEGGTRTFSLQTTDTLTTIENGKRSSIVSTARASGSKPLKRWNRRCPSPLAPMPWSPAQEAACAYLVSPLPGGPGWSIPDIEGEMRGPGMTIPTSGAFSVRIPNHGGAGGKFSRTVNGWEASGVGEFGTTLAPGGFVEMPWRGGGGSGQFSASMLAWSIGPGVTANTAVVARRMFAASPGPVDLFPGRLTVSWQLGARPPRTELKLAPLKQDVYERWLPLPKFAHTPATTPLAIQAEFKPKKPDEPAARGRIDFFLTEVSSHRGECCNHPRERGMKDDLRFAEKQPEGILVDPGNPKHAYTEKQMERASVLVEAEDGGAHGRVTARCEELNLVGLYEPLGTFYLSLPRDDDGNHVADCWEDEHDARGLSTDWDEEQVSGQEATGDGLSLYREYRGFRVLINGKPDYRRLLPRRKELFLIDPAGSLPDALWEAAAGIALLRLDESMVQGGGDPATSRIVDFTMGEASGQHKYAVRLETIRGLADPYPPPGATGPPDTGMLGYCDSGGEGRSPKDALRVCLFPDRMRATVLALRSQVELALNDPGSAAARQMEKKGIPPWLARRALERFGDSTVEALVRQMTAVAALHETGHACGLPGHMGKLPDGSTGEGSFGDATCYMRYPDNGNQWDLGVLQVLFGSERATGLLFDKFCREGAYGCFSRLNVKD